VGRLLDTASEQPRREPFALEVEQVGHATYEPERITSQASRGIEHVLERIVRGVPDVRLGIDRQPWLARGTQHVAGVQVGAEQHFGRRGSWQGAEQLDAFPHETGVEL
jgi:hypothetical protein